VHELSLAQAIIDTVGHHADGAEVRCAYVRIGYLRQVVPDSLQFSWQVLTDGTALEGCKLAIEHVPAVVTCTVCGTRTTLDLPVLACGSCPSPEVELVSGEEFLIDSIDVAEEVR
jgi:hydrogenase nickel incorporation protein HypA/HybF